MIPTTLPLDPKSTPTHALVRFEGTFTGMGNIHHLSRELLDHILSRRDEVFQAIGKLDLPYAMRGTKATVLLYQNDGRIDEVTIDRSTPQTTSPTGDTAEKAPAPVGISPERMAVYQKIDARMAANGRPLSEAWELYTDDGLLDRAANLVSDILLTLFARHGI